MSTQDEPKQEMPGYQRMVQQGKKQPYHDDRGNTFKPVNVKKGANKQFAKVKR